MALNSDILGLSWAHIGQSWGPIGALVGLLGAILGRLGAPLGRLGPHFAVWPVFGGRRGAVFGPVRVV